MITMDYALALTDAVRFTRDTVWGRCGRWIYLAISTIIFPFMMGYTMEIFRGNPVPPECNNWLRRFIDGIKYLIASFIYAIPVILVLILSMIPIIMEFMNQISNESVDFSLSAFVPYIIPCIAGIIVAFILAIIIAIISIIGIIRMARTNRFIEAFNFRAILNTIRTIGWKVYIIGLVNVWLISFIIGFLLDTLVAVDLTNFFVALFIWPLIIIFESRYLTLLYESSGE
ncbi:DUF4013 domain-containing protein [Methanospirillum stamsii]|nr:DUF4013 domain-containing protein [Methanospirillum stamsii]